MHLSAHISSSAEQLHAAVQTNDAAKTLLLPAKPNGQGAAINGGELLLLALATCFCNDLYREAAKRGLALTAVRVECTGEFGAAGEAGRHFQYRAHVEAGAPAADIEALLRHTDQVAEVHNTLRQGLAVTLTW
ncbi:OsmC family protein [Hymenobacter jeollabukensis]|uniref:OsmC family protein n=1 Tax=Hymenobacter jeollabukensis TaxID=2025313 RepID=A0A5R8WMB0_9BACT|nr:OsmC family protein [Hymenobacter jeollabukensis]TLM90029.1 OsmC family protein [Hymenobacter jeollabukensis]